MPREFRSKAPAPLLASGIDFVLEGLYAMKKISRSDERGYHGDAKRRCRRPTREAAFTRRGADAHRRREEEVLQLNER